MQYIKPLNEWIEIHPDFLFELSNNSTLYHRSLKKLKVGDKISPNISKDGGHWLKQKLAEVALEHLRKKEFPNRPSRFTSIYSSVIPRSRFVDKGYLYAIKPIGNMFITNSMFIDIINRDFDRNIYSLDGYGNEEVMRMSKLAKEGDESALDQLLWYLPPEADSYWKGTERGDMIDLEVLSDGAVVTEVIPDTKRLKINQTVTVVEEGLIARLDLYFNSRHNTNKIFTSDEIQDFINNVKENIFIDHKIDRDRVEQGKGLDGSDVHSISLQGTLKKGSKLKLTYVVNSILYKTNNDFGSSRQSRYKKLMFDFWLDKKIYRRGDDSPHFRFEATDNLNTHTFDMSKYLK